MTNFPLTGKVKVTCIYKKKGNWSAGFHTGIDLVCSDKTVYATCNGKVTKVGYDADGYGNYIVIQDEFTGKFHWLCHLAEKSNKKVGEYVTRTDKVGIMGETGNATGEHVHFEIRNKSNKYGDVVSPADYMGIPNKLGTYNTKDYPTNCEGQRIYEDTDSVKDSNSKIYTLASATYLREKPTKNSDGVLYKENTTLYILERNVAHDQSGDWHKVKIRVNGKTGYMIDNFK